MVVSCGRKHHDIFILITHEKFMKSPAQLWKVGELAKLVGVSVRTLHHYDNLGLLTPSRRSEKGYRLYTAEDLMKLQLIKSLQQLDFSLVQIKQSLERPGFSLLDVIPQQIQRLQEQITAQQTLCDRLATVAERMKARQQVSPQEFIQLIYLTTMIDNHYSPEQREWMKKRAEELGPEHIKEVEQEWPKLIATVRAEMEKGTDPSDPVVQKLARRWMELVKEFTGGRPDMEKSVGNVWKHEGDKLRQQHGDGVPTPEMFQYIQKAMKESE